MIPIIKNKLLFVVIISKPDSSEKSKQYNALIDTGATHSCISQRVSDELALEKNGKGTMKDASNNDTEVDMNIANLLLPEHTKSIRSSFAVMPAAKKECDIIIGMDLLQYGKLILEKKEFAFTIEELK